MIGYLWRWLDLQIVADLQQHLSAKFAEDIKDIAHDS